MDEDVGKEVQPKSMAWTKEGFYGAVRLLLEEKNTLFESLSEKLVSYPEFNTILQTLLFSGKNIAYNADNEVIDMAAMFGFIKNRQGNVMISNRIFEMRLYNMYLSTAEIQEEKMYKASLRDKSQFIVNGRLNMKRVLEKFAEHFTDLYHDRDETFVEEEGRKYFLLYLRPIINGTGNYHIEYRTRNLGRTDVIVDYCGEQYIITIGNKTLIEAVI